ncbi:hypothetical protein [Paraburkholderia graminis]|uniref:Uncharacterized protein n=1 Tax=Paraburkholderia graminis TaxID=60548 RepID=A0ABD5CB78_9BURK|nr:hypothetical protein [Paraburkholderia graminis]MDR6202510.1 hypothetical protein [Paraburkholderia graminis]
MQSQTLAHPPSGQFRTDQHAGRIGPTINCRRDSAVVLVMRPVDMDADTVGVDNSYGFTLAAEHLIDEGHTDLEEVNRCRLG